MPQPNERLRDEAKRIIEAGALGRASSYARLLTYLVECTVNDRVPKELEVAMEVFGKGLDFDPSQHAMVRVYAHNLRHKLHSYYAGDGSTAGYRLTVSRGEYRVQLLPAANGDTRLAASEIALPNAAAPAAHEGAPAARRSMSMRSAGAAAGLLACGALLGHAVAGWRAPTPPAHASVATSSVWRPLLDDKLPILIVVGDYYIFGERDASGEVARLVRDFGINSSRDLDERMLHDVAASSRYLDLSLTYLPTGSAFALRDVLRVAHAGEKTIRIASMSELSAAELKAGHIIYLGYISALGMLEDFVFASSGLAVGYNYDELRNRGTGEVYTSEAGIPGSDRNYRDYGLLSAFPGPNGNQLLVIAGTRDAGLMQAAQALSDPTFLADIENAVPSSADPVAPAFELLYEVTGYGGTNLDAMLVHTAELSYRSIWGGELRRGGPRP